MSTLAATSLALALSAALLALLAWRDPKRLRNRLPPGPEPLPPGLRRRLGWASLLPGLVLAFAGQWPALLIWLAACCSLGWALTQWLAPAAMLNEPDADTDSHLTG